MAGAKFDALETLAQGGNGPMHPGNIGAAVKGEPLSNLCGDEASCRSWNAGYGNPEAFIALLAAIRESADGCKEGGGYVNPVK